MKNSIRTARSADGKIARLTIGGSKDQTSVDFDTAGLDDLIWRLCALRVEMKPPIPRSPENVPTHTIANPVFALGRDPLSGQPSIGIRHPGMGWVMACPEPNDRAEIAQHLTDDHAPPQPIGRA